ncbi:MAG: NADP-dependent malic enzyme [Candidatus Saccharimonadales bacterium]
MTIYDEAMQAHLNLRGKLEVNTKVPLESKHDLSIYYSPGVGAVASHLGKHPEETPLYTGTNNSVAIISDGSAVLGLGNIGPEGALPVMEGKAMLFKQFADIDGYPIVLNTQDPDKIIDAVVAIAPSFGGINLEDIAAPHCFYIESELKKRLSIPIMHDDQHGTAIVTLAGLINACRVTKRDLSKSKIVIVGAGAAGVAIAKLLYRYAKPSIVAVDSKGILTRNRTDLNQEKQLLLSYGDKKQSDGSLRDAVAGADIFIGVSRGGLLIPAMVQTMAKDPIIFAMANPEPEIDPELAKQAGAAIVATGRSDYPNQVNNVLAFPGIFRGALDTKSQITDAHKIAAAEAIADIVRNPNPDVIIPSALDEKVVRAVSSVFERQ